MGDPRRQGAQGGKFLGLDKLVLAGFQFIDHRIEGHDHPLDLVMGIGDLQWREVAVSDGSGRIFHQLEGSADVFGDKEHQHDDQNEGNQDGQENIVPDGGVDAQDVITFETGHFLGLSHDFLAAFPKLAGHFIPVVRGIVLVADTFEKIAVASQFLFQIRDLCAYIPPGVPGSGQRVQKVEPFLNERFAFLDAGVAAVKEIVFFQPPYLQNDIAEIIRLFNKHDLVFDLDDIGIGKGRYSPEAEGKKQHSDHDFLTDIELYEGLLVHGCVDEVVPGVNNEWIPPEKL